MLTRLIKRIQKILGNGDWAEVKVTFYASGKEMCFDIYETEIPIVVDFRKNTVELLTECIKGNLTVDELEEITKIVKLIEANLPKLGREFGK